MTDEKTKLSSGKTYHDDLSIVRSEVDKCMKCGNCMAVCPVYGV
ncbi:MAG TPA: 4Fe-4S dicluster domain-containing protein, partial [Spirochaetota bacterium]|nr:4Fe-4S dicluster domain-containing protein [Spirochaetota bacterium]